MKKKIITYGREYIENFKQNKRQSYAVLAMQILFLLGWGIFFYDVPRYFIRYYIPGDLQTKGNIYAELISDSILFIIFTFVFYKFCKIMLSNHSSIKNKIIIFTASVVSIFVWAEFGDVLFKIFDFLPETHIAFWAR